MNIDSMLALTEISIIVIIGIVFGAVCTFLFTYKKTRDNLDRIYELEQILDKNKIWIHNS
jgi:uncharacterized membrane protein YdjX (TVP38/TMEM64 family)